MELRNLEMMLEREVGVLKDIKEFVDKYGDSIAEDVRNIILDYVASVEKPWNATYEACKAVVAEIAEKREQEKTAEDKSKAKADKAKPVRKKNSKEPEKEADDEDWSFLGDE